MLGRLARRLTARFWSPERSERTPEGFWMAHPAVRAYINQSVTGDPGRWPLDRLQSRLGGERMARTLVPGCGTGELERDLLARGLCERVDAFDLSPSAVDRARALAEAAGVGAKVTHSVASFEDFEAPEGAYDGCFFHHSLHHSPSPERVLEKVEGWLAPGGLLYLDEYVGPSQHDWNRRTFALASAIYETLPGEVKRNRRLQIPGLLARLADPSESMASHRILPTVESLFEIVDRRDYGGFLLHPIWTQLRLSDALVDRLIAAEQALAPLHPSWYTAIVARKR